MIESVEKRKRLTDVVTHWCKHTNHRNIRNGDVLGLVGTILSEFYHITLSCGCMVREFDEGTALAFKENDGSEIQGSYCKDCAKKYKKNLGAWEIK